MAVQKDDGISENKEVKAMAKFSYAVFNPPYQTEKEDTSDNPVYNYFMDAANTIAGKVEVITPARFLFNAGKTSKKWNQELLNNPHFKVMKYEANSKKVFPNTDIKGGIAISYYDHDKNFGAIELYTPYQEMHNVYLKVKDDIKKNGNLSDIMFLQNKFDLASLYADHPDYMKYVGSDGKERRLVSSCFEKNPIFEEAEHDGYIKILGIMNISERMYRWVNPKYITDNGNLYKYKVIVPNSNGSGALGEVISTPLIGTPLIGYTQSFIGIGAFDAKSEATHALKYVKSKFCRATLGLLKITQSASPDKWIYVPLQNFTDQSDIDWDTSIHEIDQQLYQKYGLFDNEIQFIEKHVKVME